MSILVSNNQLAVDAKPPDGEPSGTTPLQSLLPFLVLIGFQLLGEVLNRVFHLPLPGPVIGMFLLTALLVRRQRNPASAGVEPRPDLARTANSLITNMGLLFVPAGVGVMTESDLLRQQWLPIFAGIVGSTLLSLVVTGLILHHVSRVTSESPGKAAKRGGY